jgi:hypothetical protein
MPIGNLQNNLNRQNSEPELTQNQPNNAPFGTGLTQSDTIPNVTRKVQYAAEGNNPFSQLISAGDIMIHNAGQDYGSGEVKPNNYDITNALYDIARAPKQLYNARNDENDRIRQNTRNENLNQSFLNNMGDNVSQVGANDIERYGNMTRLHEEDDENNTAAMNIANLSTKEAMDAYYELLSKARNNPTQQIPRGQLYQMRRLHNELARRGINTSIFNAEHNLNDDEQRSLIDDEMKNHNNRYHIFHENPEEFHQRTRLFDFPADHPIAANGRAAILPPPPANLPQGWAQRIGEEPIAPPPEELGDGLLEANRDFSRISPAERERVRDMLATEYNNRYGAGDAHDMNPELNHLTGVDIENMMRRLNVPPPPPPPPPAPQGLHPGMDLRNIPIDVLNNHMFHLRRPPSFLHPEYNHLDRPHRNALADEIDRELITRDRLSGGDDTLEPGMPLNRFSPNWLDRARRYTTNRLMRGVDSHRLNGLNIQQVRDLHGQLTNEINNRRLSSNRSLAEQGVIRAINGRNDDNNLPFAAAQHVYNLGGTPEQAAEARVLAANHIIRNNPRTAPQRAILNRVINDPNSTPEEKDIAFRNNRFKFNLDALTHMDNRLPQLDYNDPNYERNNEERWHLNRYMSNLAREIVPTIDHLPSSQNTIDAKAFLHSIMSRTGHLPRIRHLDDFRDENDLRRLSDNDLLEHMYQNSLAQNQFVQNIPIAPNLYRGERTADIIPKRQNILTVLDERGF